MRMPWMRALVVAGAASLAFAAYGDCGSVPFYSPFEALGNVKMETTREGGADVDFDPRDVVVYEPGQRAIVLWDGQEEILLLSTEIRTNQAVSILEVIPFPTEPEVTLGAFETFEKMQALYIEKAMWRVASGGGVPGARLPDGVAAITFHEQMGAHDIMVVKVLNTERFREWVLAFLQSRDAVNPHIDPAFLNIIDGYIKRGYTWFVFDTIQTRDEVQSRQPIQYRFESDYVYYPLEISTRETGHTMVDLLVLTRQPMTQFPELKQAAKRDDVLTVNKKDLEPIQADWAAFMGDGDLSMERIRIEGDIQAMVTDFLAR